MGRDKKAGHGPGPGASAKERHKKQSAREIDWAAPAPSGLQARLEQPGLKIKHKSYYEFVENKDKKKKLEYEVTSDKHPPPGFEFVPMGNPELTNACKDISREQGAMIFIVSTHFPKKMNGHTKSGNLLSQEIHRIGHHIRAVIVEQARELIGVSEDSGNEHQAGVPEPIPESQEEINRQADAAIRDLFPRIPNTDRQQIIERSFNKAANPKKGPLVGLAPDISLSRRAQLAVLAHIRHTHTRYDQLLSETSWEYARKAVEPVSLEILVKWRGDEETGRDQLDEILREVIVISDSESDSDDDDDNDSDIEILGDAPIHDGAPLSPMPLPEPAALMGQQDRFGRSPRHRTRRSKRVVKGSKDAGTSAFKAAQSAARKAQRGFKRYEAVQAKWDEAITRVRNDPSLEQHRPVAMDRSISHSSRPGQPLQILNAQPEHQRNDPYGSYQNGARKSLPAPDRTTPVPLTKKTLAHAAQGAANIPNPNSRHEAYWTAGASPHRRVVSSSSVRAHWNSPVNKGRDEHMASRSQNPRPEDLRDYLIPSIEPRSPGVGPSGRPSGPIFVRTVESPGTSRPREELPSAPSFSRAPPPAPAVASAAFPVRPRQPSPGRGPVYPPHSAPMRVPDSVLPREYPMEVDMPKQQRRPELISSNSQKVSNLVPIDRDSFRNTGAFATREPREDRQPQYVRREDLRPQEVARLPHGMQTTRIVDERGNVIKEELRPARYVESYSTQPIQAPRYIDSHGPVTLPPGHEIIRVHRPVSSAPIRVPEDRRVFLVDEAPPRTALARAPERQRLEAIPVTAPPSEFRPGGEVQRPTYHRIIRDESGRVFVPVSASHRADDPVPVSAPASRVIQAREGVPPSRSQNGNMQTRGPAPDPRSGQAWSQFAPQPSTSQVVYLDQPPVTQAEHDAYRRHHQQWQPHGQ